MATEFQAPGYPHDKDKYDAVCRWLGLMPRTFGQKILPEFFYRDIAGDLTHKDGEWVYDKERAAGIFLKVANQRGAVLEAASVPPDGYELFFKHIYKGMLEAGLYEACDRFPRCFTLDPNAPRMISVGTEKSGHSIIGLSPAVASTMTGLAIAQQSALSGEHAAKLQLAVRLADIENVAYKIQCMAHFDSTHASIPKNDSFDKDRKSFVEETCRKREQRKLSSN